LTADAKATHVDNDVGNDLCANKMSKGPISLFHLEFRNRTYIYIYSLLCISMYWIV